MRQARCGLANELLVEAAPERRVVVVEGEGVGGAIDVDDFAAGPGHEDSVDRRSREVLLPGAARVVERDDDFQGLQNDVRSQWVNATASANFWSHAQLFWEDPSTRPTLEEFATQHTLIQLDLPGCGLSDAETGWLSVERLTGVITAVVDALGYDRISLVGAYHVCMVLLRLAAEQPSLVDRLGLLCPYARGPEYWERSVVQAFASAHAVDWDMGVEAMLVVAGGAQKSPAELAALVEMWKQSVTRQNLVRYVGFFRREDVSGLLGRVSAPTLVLNRADNPLFPPAFGRAVAAGIPRAEFRVIPGRSVWLGDSPSAIPAVIEFLTAAASAGDAGAAHAPPRDRPPATRARDTVAVSLSPRELEVLRLIADGKSNPEIAEELVIAPGTAGRHVSNLLAKTGLKNRVELARYAARHGLIEE